MIEPKSYPSTDSQEQDARTVLETLLDSRFEKIDIRTRDKVPNIDGTIELVNEKIKPIGKFDIQLRSIPKGQTSHSCETTLVAYSKTATTLPVLLICVDSQNKLAYWKHINQYMPEFKDKETQQSFVIHFSKESDIIDISRVYRYKWIEIASYYQECIAKYPSISARDIEKIGLETIEPSEREIFQRFIETINNLLDNDFIVIKEIVFPGVWKLGVGIISSDQHHIQYQIYSIPYKDPSPLVCKLIHGSLFTNKWNKNAVKETRTSKESLLDPIKAGKEFVSERVVAVLKSKLLHIYGQELSSDILFSFVDLYHPALGIKPGSERYLVQDLSIALNKHLFAMAEAALVENIPVGNRKYSVDLDKLTYYIKTNTPTSKNVFGKPIVFSIGTDSFPISTAYDSLKYLIANGIKEINRSRGLSDIPLAPGASWVWSGYSPENEIKNVTHILNHSLDEYKAFVNGNKLKFPNSHYLDSDTTIIFEYEPIKGSKFEEGPGLNEYHIDNSSHTLPKLIVYAKDKALPHLPVGSNTEEKYYTVTYDGKTYKAHSISYSIGHFLFDSTPVLNLVYRMLLDDLSLHYDMTINSAII